MTKDNFKLRFATREDIDNFYGQSLYSVRAWVLEYKDQVVAIGGLILLKGRYVAFIKDLKELPKKIFWRVSKNIVAEMRKLNFPIYAIRDEKLESSERYLTKLGFRHFQTHNNQEIFILWQEQ